MSPARPHHRSGGGEPANAATPTSLAHPTSLVASSSGKAEAKHRIRKAKNTVTAGEDDLLEAVLQEREAHAALETGGTSTGPDLLRLVLCCDTNRLNTRLELIRNFGSDSVEDIGCGSTSRRGQGGGTRDTGAHSLFPEHHVGGQIKFRPSVFASPNRYRWPPLDSQGVFLSIVNTDDTVSTNPATATPGVAAAATAVGSVVAAPQPLPCGRMPLVYRLHSEAAPFQRASAALQRCVTRLGGAGDLVDCLNTHGHYHIPTLLQASATFELLGQTSRSQELVDVALYHVGILLGNIPLSATWRRRLVPHSYASNHMLFDALQRGVHVAWRRGCTRTAWEMSRFLLSLDTSDPCGVLLLIDCLALRAKRWVWLLELYDVLRHPVGCKDAMERHLESKLVILPAIPFSCALAKYFMEREMRHAPLSSGSSASGGGASRVLRDMTAEQRETVGRCPLANVMLAEAMVAFPEAAVRLVEGLSLLPKMGSAIDPNWQLLVASTTNDEASLSSHLAQLFVARHCDMWKSTEVVQWVREVLTAAPADGPPSALATAMVQKAFKHSLHCSTPAALLEAQQVYLGLREEDVMGTNSSAIPADLLNQVDDVEELRRLMEEQVQLAEDDRPLAPLEMDRLLRFRALYAEAPEGTSTDAQLLHAYQSRFEMEGGAARNLSTENPLRLFIRSLLPWNTTRDMALQEALRRHGIEDPVVVRNRQLRTEDARTWEADQDVAAAEWESLPSDASSH